MSYIELVGGLIYLLMGGDLLVRGAVGLARRLRISPMIVGLTVVALGTSLPELVVSVQAAFAAVPEIAIGNVVGSNVANVLLVVGTPAVLYPIACGASSLRRDAAIMLGISVLFVALCLAGPVTRLSGLVLFSALVLFLAYNAREALRAQERAEGKPLIEWALGLPTSLWLIVLFILVGGIWLPLGARLTVDAAVAVAADLGISNAAVGLTVVAVGTSLPEVTTTLVAAARAHADIALGNVIGSNVLNIALIMGTVGLVSPQPIPIPPAFPFFELPVMLAAALVLAGLAWRGRSIGRGTGVLLLAAYAAYAIAVFRIS